MNQDGTFSTAIILLDKKAETDTIFVRKWLEKSRFFSIETSDIFQALEELSDFTVRRRIEVILLKVNSLTNDFPAIREIIKSSSNDVEICILALSNTGNIINHEDCFEGNLAQLQVKLDEVIPKRAYVRAA